MSTVNEVRRVLCYGALVSEHHVVCADKRQTRTTRYIQDITFSVVHGRSPTINGSLSTCIEFSVLTLIFPHVDVAFLAILYLMVDTYVRLAWSHKEIHEETS